MDVIDKTIKQGSMTAQNCFQMSNLKIQAN